MKTSVRSDSFALATFETHQFRRGSRYEAIGSSTAPSFVGPAWHPAVSSLPPFAFALSGTRGKIHRGQAAQAVPGQEHYPGKSDAYENTESPEPGG